MAADDKFRHIKDLLPGMKNVTCVFIVIDKGTTNQTKDGSVVRKCRVADKSASICFSLWNEQAEAIEPGDILRLTKGYSSLWKGSMVLYSGKYGILEKIGEFTMVYTETPDMSDPGHDFVQQAQQQQQQGARGGGGVASQAGSNGMSVGLDRGNTSGNSEPRNGGRNGTGYGIAGNRNGNNHNPPIVNGNGMQQPNHLPASSNFDDQKSQSSHTYYPPTQHRGPPQRPQYQQPPRDPKLEFNPPPHDVSHRPQHRGISNTDVGNGRYHPYSRPSNEAVGWR